MEIKRNVAAADERGAAMCLYIWHFALNINRYNCAKQTLHENSFHHTGNWRDALAQPAC
jgi:hypothetical protein